VRELCNICFIAKALDFSLRVDRAVEIEVVGTEKLTMVTYVVAARGEVQLSSMLPASNSKRFSFKFLPSFDMIPQATLLVFYITSGGEIISDSVPLEFGGDLRNFVDIKTTEQAKPGEVVNISIKSQPKSIVGLLAVDQSVKLLRTGNDIEKSAVMNDLLSYSYSDRYNYEYRENLFSESYSDFWTAKLLIITNAKREFINQI
jgi:CD109 antigen